jgi:2-succinyl-6-hydroxy-2,4-cyclohexadiene-1-carboxylate synthase
MASLPVDRMGAGPRLALVHGFTQTRRSWQAVAARLAADHEVVTVDAPGHGGAGDVRVGLVEGGELLADAAGPATYVGYSMGGRLCLHTALHRPDEVRGLVLLGATGGIDDPEERARRRAADEALAARIEAVGVAAFLDEWLAQPLFATLDPATADRPGRAVNTPAGLASSLRLAGTGTQRPLWDELEDVEVPVLVLAGELDERFRAAGARLAAAVGPNATFEVVPGAGHTAHLERPDAFVGLVAAWLARHGL